MRIVAGTMLGNSIRLVWHCEQCRRVACEWLDTDTAQYMELRRTGPNRLVQARTIVFDETEMVVYINPLDVEEHPQCSSLTTAA